MSINFVWMFIIGYLFGCFQTSFFYGKLKGIDIREHGSGNAGTTNALRVMGKKAGALVLLGDIGKMLLAAYVSHLLFDSMGEEYALAITLITAIGAVIGHDYPFYLHFKGGKGIAVTGGLVILLGLPYFIVGVVLFFGITLTTCYVSLASCVMIVCIVVEFIILTAAGITVTGILPIWAADLILSAWAVLALYRHRTNIKRLINGTENKTVLIKKKN